MSTCGKYSQHQNKNPDLCRPVMMGNLDPRVSIPAGFPTGIPVVSRGLPGLVLSLTFTLMSRLRIIITISQCRNTFGVPFFIYSLPSSIKGLYLYDIRQYEYCLPCIYCAHRNHYTSLLNYRSETYLLTPGLGVDLSSLLRIRSYVKFRQRDSKRAQLIS